MTSLQVAELIGAQRPAWSHLPSEVRSSAGAEAIDLARAAGLILDDWQSWVLDKSLGENNAGSWSAFEVALLVGRQNGKNAILEARELAGIVLFGDDLIVHTAHRADTTMEHFRRMEQYAEEFDEFRRLVKRVSRKNGEESIEIKGRRRIKFVCRSRNPGRGFSGSCIVFEEALASLDGGVIGAMIPTLATRSMAQVWYTSSAPRSDSSFLHDVCRRGRGDGDEPRLFYAEWGNEPDVDFDDWDAIARANPGLGVRISRQFVEDERRLMSATPTEFARERLGIPEEPAGTTGGPIAIEVWQSLTDGDSLPVDGTERLSLEVAPDRSFSTFGIAGKRADNLGHVSIRHRLPGTSWVVDRAKELTDGHHCPLTIVSGSPAAGFIPELELAGVAVDVMSPAEFAGACQRFVDAVNAPEPLLRHRGSPDHTAAVAAAQIKPAGDGGFVLSRRTSSSDITPLTSAVVAWARVGHGEPNTYDVLASVL